MSQRHVTLVYREFDCITLLRRLALEILCCWHIFHRRIIYPFFECNCYQFGRFFFLRSELLFILTVCGVNMRFERWNHRALSTVQKHAWINHFHINTQSLNHSIPFDCQHQNLLAAKSTLDETSLRKEKQGKKVFFIEIRSLETF